jgi:hypothetical protein
VIEDEDKEVKFQMSNTDPRLSNILGACGVSLLVIITMLLGWLANTTVANWP